MIVPPFRHLARMAAAAYLNEDDAVEAALAAGYEEAVLVDRGATEILAAANPREILVAPRGSSSPIDWVDDALFKKTRFDGLPGEVHLGFSFQLGRALTEVYIAVRGYQIIYPDALLAFAGHSMGGVLATYLCSFLATPGDGTTVVTFGSPRGFDDIGAALYDDWYGSSTWRVAHPLDLVARVPRIASGYCHVGNYRHPGAAWTRNATGRDIALAPAMRSAAAWRDVRASRDVTHEESLGVLGELRRSLGQTWDHHPVDRYVAAEERATIYERKTA